jgi:ABC-type oligopeptide transport system ATPase subunit
MSEPLLKIDGLSVDYVRRRHGTHRAVDDVSFSIERGETLGLVGESGSGKTTIGRAILGLVPVAAGTIHFEGEDITRFRGKSRRALTQKIQVVFQDPYASLNPVRTIGATLAEPLLVHEPSLNKSEARARIVEVLALVGLPSDMADRLPSEFSGGQRQRIAIARAIIVRPALVVCDEAVSSLDLSIQAQVLNLLTDLQDRSALSYLFISHDLAVVQHVASRVAVLSGGRLVELETAERIARCPRHPYTAMLHAAAPVPDPEAQRQRRAEFERRYAQREVAEAGSQHPGQSTVEVL